MATPKVKVKAQVLIAYNDKILVYRVKDEKTGQNIYRLIGGRVEFGELSEKAAIREFFEETHLQVHRPKFLGTFESIYIMHGKQKHELVQVYVCEFIDKSQYNKTRIKLFEPGEILNDAEWVDANFLSQKTTPFYPEMLKETLADNLLDKKKI